MARLYYWQLIVLVYPVCVALSSTLMLVGLVFSVTGSLFFVCTFQHKIYHTNKGVAMGSPISNTITEIFIQHYENTYIKQVLDLQSLQYYSRYVDDILIIYVNSKITQECITQQINQIHNNIKFNPTYEPNNTINFLDLTNKEEHTKFINRRIQNTNDHRYHYSPYIKPPSVT